METSERVEDNQQDMIRVKVVHYVEVFADAADLYVTIKGSSLVTGSSALQKAQEVRQLVTELAKLGIAEKDIHLQRVSAEISSGMLGKSSSASYHLKIHCLDLASLADILGIITAQKNITLHSIAWGYKSDNDIEGGELRDRWLETCIRRANEKAARIAANLGVTILGVHHFHEIYQDSASHRPIAGSVAFDFAMVSEPSASRQRAMTQEDLGLAVTHSKTMDVGVLVEHRVSGR
jgi:uncharacterized protein YggE